MIDIHTGAQSGVEAFLAGRVALRGNINLALRLESLFAPVRPRPATAPKNGTLAVGPWQASVMEAGVGEPVILLHGLAATKASFLPTLVALAGDHRVIAPDLLGHGDTSKPRVRYDAATLARFVVDLMDAEGVDRAHLVGNSLGGRIALEVAMAHPDRVVTASLLCPAVAYPERRWFMPLLRAVHPKVMLLPRRLPHGAVVRGIRTLFVRPDRLPRSWYVAGADEFLRIFHQPGNRYALYDALRHIATEEPDGARGFWTRLGRLERPAMFLWGDGDPLVSPRFAEVVGRVLPHAPSEVLEACGHVPQFELPEVAHRRIRRFMATAS